MPSLSYPDDKKIPSTERWVYNLGGYYWLDQSPVQFTYWTTGHPQSSATINHCVETVWAENGRWRETHCDAHHNYLCQTPASKCHSRAGRAKVPWHRETRHCMVGLWGSKCHSWEPLCHRWIIMAHICILNGTLWWHDSQIVGRIHH